MSTPERQQDEGDYGYGAADQGDAGDERPASHAQPARPADDAREENPTEGPVAPATARPDDKRDTKPITAKPRDVERRYAATPTTTGARPEQAPDDQQTG